jgi:uncharacterized C2H2 Zn-finger protein
LLWDISDGEVILRCTFRCDECGKEVKRFRHRIYAEDFSLFVRSGVSNVRTRRLGDETGFHASI